MECSANGYFSIILHNAHFLKPYKPVQLYGFSPHLLIDVYQCFCSPKPALWGMVQVVVVDSF